MRRKAERRMLLSRRVIGGVEGMQGVTVPVNRAAARRQAVVVLGMHRSGTSALTRALHILGLALPDDLLPAADDNTQGYFEAREFVRLNQELLAAAGTAWHDPAPIPDGWPMGNAAMPFRQRAAALIEVTFSASNVVVLKDPRFSRLLPFWCARFSELDVSIACVLILRDPREVAQSLQARVLSEASRPAGTLSLAKAHWLWLRYVLDGERHSRGLPRAFLTYDGLLENSHASLSDVAQKLGIRYPASLQDAAHTLEDALSRGLKRQHSVGEHPLGWPGVAVSVYRAFADHVERGHPLDLARLDGLSAALQQVPRPAEPIPDEGIHAYSLRSSAVLTDLGGIRSGGTASPTILFVSGSPEAKGHLYRVEHHLEALQAGGVHAEWCTVPDVDESRLNDVSTVVVFRAVWDTRLSALYESCRKRGIGVGFDVDDLVFDPVYMREPYFHYLKYLDDAQRQEWASFVAGWRQSLLEADFAIVSTEPLAEAARKLGKRAHVWRNGLSWDMVENARAWSSDLHRPSRSDGRIRLGYASGSPTHQKDFGRISGCLAATLAQKPNVALTVVGHLDFTEFPELAPHADRIEARPLVPHRELAGEFARFDVNLAPLQAENPFCEAKSELKYFEAAMARVPTVASATGPFKAAIRSGINGYCVEREAEWRECLLELIENDAERRRLGREAYWHAIVRFGPEAQCLDGLEVLADLSAGAG